MDASEREQYRAAIHGDREAFEMIIRIHSRTLFAIGAPWIIATLAIIWIAKRMIRARRD